MNSNHIAALLDYRDKLQEYTLIAYCGRSYVQGSKLTRWLRSKVQLGQDQTTQAHRLLDTAYRNRHSPIRWIEIDKLLSDEERYAILFGMLLELDRFDMIDDLWRLTHDEKLPIDLPQLKIKFKDANLPQADTISREFDKLQWKFFPAKLNLKMDARYPPQQVLPFRKKDPINDKGATAQLFQVEVLEEFVGQTLRDRVTKSRYDPADGLGPRYEFALKTFDEDHRSAYMDESDAFNALQKQNNIVQYLGGFSHKVLEKVRDGRGPSVPTTSTEYVSISKNTHNILLEYGDADLEEYFADHVPPFLQPEIEEFYKELFVVANAIKSIHNYNPGDGRQQEYYGWHADIKPDNILIVHGKVKLADPGFVKFFIKTDKPPSEDLPGGTETYGAPEWYKALTSKTRRANRITQAIDIWSFGCVLSIAATWVVLGHQGILQFNQLRIKAIQKIVKEQQHLPSDQRTLNEGDYFHNGSEVLDAVTQWHDILRKATRPIDSVTKRILDLVDSRMLCGDVGKRISCNDLCAKLKDILAKAGADPRINVTSNIEALLHEIDNAASQSSGSKDSAAAPVKSTFGHSIKTITIRDQRKSKFAGPALMQTAQRSKVLRPAPTLINPTSEPLPKIAVSHGKYLSGHYDDQRATTRPSYPSEPGVEASQHSNHSFQENELARTGSHRRSKSDLSTLTTPPRLPRRSKMTTDRQNVFQAREEVELREKNNIWKSVRKDQKLSQHFGHRDIKFLVDNAETMNIFWYEATFLLQTLLWKARGLDENGMDLSFTNGTEEVVGEESKLSKISVREDPFVKKMRKARPTPGTKTKTDLTQSLGVILHDYLNDVRLKKLHKKRVRGLTLIILTDGLWEGMHDKDEVGRKIVEFVNLLRDEIGELQKRLFSIQFIQFGDDKDATYLLWTLDNELKSEGIPDIVDTELCSGDVNKMLLGSFVEWWDLNEDDADFDSVVLSPSQESVAQ